LSFEVSLDCALVSVLVLDCGDACGVLLGLLAF
jgi:hypothetical protein